MNNVDKLLINIIPGDEMISLSVCFRKTKFLLFYILILFSIFAYNPAFGAISSWQATCNPPRPIVGTGDVISVGFRYILDMTNVNASRITISAPGVCNPVTITANAGGGGVFTGTANLTVAAGTLNNDSVSISCIVTETDGTTTKTYLKDIGTVEVNNEPPTQASVMTYTVTPASALVNGVIRSGATVKLTSTVTKSDVQTAVVNLNGLNQQVNLTKSGTTFTGQFGVPDNYQGNVVCDLTLTDNVGNTTTYTGNNTLNLTIDSRLPQLQQATVVNAAGNVPARPGHTLNFSVQVVAYDGDTVSVISCSPNHSSISSKLPINLTPNGNPTTGSTVTFQGNMVLTTDNTCFYDNTLAFTFRAIDANGNERTITATFENIIDLSEFDHRESKIRVYSEHLKATAVATATSLLYFYSEVKTATGHEDRVNVSVDLTQVGGSTLNLQYDGIKYFVGTYTGGLDAVQMDGVRVEFTVTATDQYNNSITKTTTPQILIDNVGPQVSNFNITGATGIGGSIINKDRITLSATVTGANATSNPVTIDLTSLDGTGVHNFTNSSANNWQYKHNVASGTVDDVFDFVIQARDNYGNITQGVLPMKVDNEPPVWVNQTAESSMQNPPHIIIGDSITTKVTLENANDGIQVALDLTQLGNHSKEYMTSFGNEFSYSFEIATGPINNGAIFPMSITDDEGNQAIKKTTGDVFNASFTFSTLDQNPPDPSDVIVTLTNHTSTTDVFPDSINTKKTISFTLPFTRESSNDDSATATLDVTYLCKLKDGSMKYVDSNLRQLPDSSPSNLISLTKSGSQYTVTIVATDSLGLAEQDNYQFDLMMYDTSGNRAAVKSNYFPRVDLNPPVINNIIVNTTGGTPIKVGDNITFKAMVSANDGMPPTIDLTSLNPEIGKVNMGLDSVGVYSYSVTVESGEFENVTASWPITLYDGCDNSVTSYTRELTIDNKPPENVTFLVSADTIRDYQRINYTDNSTEAGSITFRLTASESLTVTFDLTAIGGSSAQPVDEVVDGPNFIYEYKTTTAKTSQEYTDYKFPATVKDVHGNTVTVYSQTIRTVDCQVPVLIQALSGLEITSRDSSLVAPKNPNIVRIGDEITFYASMSAGLDAIASVTFSVDPGVASVSKVLDYNSEKNRHEVVVTIKTPTIVEGEGEWGELNLDKISYIISAIDDSANLATPLAKESTFSVKNVYPTIASFSLVINPDFEKVGVLNIASGTDRTTRDLLVASATLENNTKIASASLDLSAIGGEAEFRLASITNSIVNSTSSGIDVAAFANIDYTSVSIPIKIYDEAGYLVESSHDLTLDTKIPEITKVTFDGEKLIVTFSETIYNIEKDQWKLVGSATVPIGTTAKLDLSDVSLVDSWTELFEEVEITLSEDGRKQVTNWASSSLYLEVNRETTTAAATDVSLNWLPAYSFFPITITDFSWRQDTSIVNFSMTHNWPNTISFDIQFSQEIDPSTFVASDAVIFVDNPPDSRTEFSDVAYDSWYVIQKEDTCNWVDSKNLKITLSNNGRDWIASRLTNDTTKTLKFAQKSAANRMATSIFDKKLKLYTIAEPYEIADNRTSNPLPALNVLSSPEPVINLSLSTLTLNFTDRVQLFKDNYRTINETDPKMGLPTLTNNNGSNLHVNKIRLFNLENDQTIQLSCESITTDLNEFASTTVTIKLTEDDLNSILDYYNTSSTINWGLQIEENSFKNLWGMGNTRYKPTTPGTVKVIEAAPTAIPTLLAASVSDMPPTKDDAGNFTFDFEVTRFMAGDNPIPFSTISSPTAGIFETSTGDKIASGTIISWNTRKVRDEERTIITFKTSEEFNKNVDGVEAELRLYELKDIFDNETPVLIASYVYDRTQRSNVLLTGFKTASEAFIIDNVAPTATVEPLLIGISQVGREDFYADYSEAMDPESIPSLTLATGSTLISFSFSRWENTNTRAVFSLNEAITPETVNGTWTYILSGGQDLATNAFVSSTTYTLVKSEIPRVVRNSMKLYTIRKNIDNHKVVVDKPFNFDASPDYTKIGFKYITKDTENVPHTTCFYYEGTQIGSATVVQNGVNATATFSVLDFSTVPAENATVTVRVIDIAGNITDVVATLSYYAVAPDISNMYLSGIATLSQGINYYRSELENMVFTAELAGEYTNPLNLLIASVSIPISDVATMTLSTKSVNNGSFVDNFGAGLAENLYSVMIADEAGNLNTTAEPLLLVIDNTDPAVESITPGPGDRIANTKIGMATFTVKFAELMDTTVEPKLTLATSTLHATIDMTFVGWGEDLMTASFTNAVAIVSTYPVGIYNYTVDNAKDLAGNTINSTPATCTVDVQPQGPGVLNFTILTLQPDISDTALENRDYNPVKYNAGDAASVTFKIDYVSGPFNTPHQLLIYNEADENIATLAVTVGNPGYATWDAGDIPNENATYHFNMIDDLNNFGPDEGYLEWTFTVDITGPQITSIAFDDGGIGQTKDGIKYYSPSVPATFSVSTTETRDLVLIASSTATTTYVVTASTSHEISFGSDLVDGDVALSVSDLAGNIYEDASITVRVDSIPPQVTAAFACDELHAPLDMVGKNSSFLVTFDEVMNQNIIPTVQLATDTSDSSTEIATLTFSEWVDDQSCLFVTNGVFDTITFPVGTSSIVVSGAKDLAGNFVATATYGEIMMISQSPVFEAELISKQTKLSDDNLTNYPFSFRVEPNVATLTIRYDTNNGPFALDHTLLLFDNAGVQIATHTLTDGATEITVDEAFFGDFTGSIASPIEYMGSFTFMLKDSVDNIATATNNFELKYDSISPKVTNITFTGISTGSTELIYYYNPDLIGSLTGKITLAASDSIRLVALGVSSSTLDAVATRTYEMDSKTTGIYTYQGYLYDSYGVPLPEGTYQLEAADMAGNFAVLSDDTAIEASRTILIDKTPPSILVATITDQLYVSSGEAGMATFSIQFDESLFESAYQYLEIATTSYRIPCRFIRTETTTLASDTAIFETAVAVQSLIPQGTYVYSVTATDLTGNRLQTNYGEIIVRSGGPIISSIKTFSYQQTTASDTLDSGNEYHYDDVFSFIVEPNAATMSIVLSEEPDGDPSLVYLNFLKKVTINQQNQEILIASYPLAVDGNLMATFTWEPTMEPIVATTATYLIRLSDVNNDLSYVSYEWSVDNVAPTYSGIAFNNGVNFPASGVVYLNPYRHTNFEVIFKNVSEINTKLRIRNELSTDTYALSSMGNNAWNTLFRGKYSRTRENPDDMMPDGIYDIGLVDQAGNTAASGTEDLYQLIIDSKNPVIGTYTLKINGVTVADYCSPSEARPLVISLETDEPLTATGAYFLDIYNSGETRVNRIELVDNGGTLEASWDAKNASGTVVSDGLYTFRVSDLCGNTSENATSTNTITSPFKAMSPAVQVASNTIKIWFNHNIEPTSLSANPITCNPALTIGNIRIEDDRAIAFTATGMTHGASYTLSIDNNLTNIYGSTLSASGSTAVFYADIKGPSIVETNYNNISTQSDIMIVFDQPLDRESAEATSSYKIVDASGNEIPIATVIVQPDNSTVMLCASGTFIENASYRIMAPGVKDELGNEACDSSISGFTFKGRDVTPPVLIVSAFSNAANENDIIVVSLSNEELIRPPTLTIKHGTASPVTMTMQRNSTNSLSFMAAASLKASNGETGTLTVEGEDLNGNVGNETNSFAIARVKTKSNVRLSSTDGQFSLAFDENSLKSDATVKILKRDVIKEETATGTLQTALQNEYVVMRGLRASVATNEEEATNSELVPITAAYEASLLSSKVNKGVVASLKVPESASQTAGLGLFYQKNGSWKFVSSSISANKDIKAKITSGHIFAIMQDTVAPSINLDESMDLSKAFETARPEFIGNVKDFGSGIDTSSVEAKIDSGVQNVPVDNNGNFKFKSLSELINGNHDLTITAKDRTGNLATTGNMRFVLVLPFEFKQIIQYPNPAKNNVKILIRTNSAGINCNIKIKIYDVAGHKVADFDESDVEDRGGGNYEVKWDLRNKKGKKVANGVYIARLEATNPETGKKVKKTLKIAVLK